MRFSACAFQRVAPNVVADFGVAEGEPQPRPFFESKTGYIWQNLVNLRTLSDEADSKHRPHKFASAFLLNLADDLLSRVIDSDRLKFLVSFRRVRPHVKVQATVQRSRIISAASFPVFTHVRELPNKWWSLRVSTFYFNAYCRFIKETRGHRAKATKQMQLRSGVVCKRKACS